MPPRRDQFAGRGESGIIRVITELIVDGAVTFAKLASSLFGGMPSDVGTENAVGSGEQLTRIDHIHRHPSGLGANLHHNQVHGSGDHSVDYATDAELVAHEANAAAHHDHQNTMVVYTANDTFAKASYPWARYVRVRVIGGGGGGAGVPATGVAQNAAGGGGGSGAYAESLIALSSLAASETITVGAAGTGGNDAIGGAGGQSSFGTHVVAGGGGGGGRTGATAGSAAAAGGTPGTASAGQIQVAGTPGEEASVNTGFGLRANGGPSVLGGAGQGIASGNGGAGARGGGGGGTLNRASESARVGGAGGAGIVIVEVL